jgi:hypothetical protein
MGTFIIDKSYLIYYYFLFLIILLMKFLIIFIMLAAFFVLQQPHPHVLMACVDVIKLSKEWAGTVQGWTVLIKIVAAQRFEDRHATNVPVTQSLHVNPSPACQGYFLFMSVLQLCSIVTFAQFIQFCIITILKHLYLSEITIFWIWNVVIQNLL